MFYIVFKLLLEFYNSAFLKTLPKASINEFSIWLCSTDPSSPFPFSGFCPPRCTLCALEVRLRYILFVVFGNDL